MRWFELVLVLAGLLEGVQGACQTLPSATASPRPCKFPFTFRGKDYFACTSDGDVSGAKWCETSAVSTPAPAAPSDSVFSAANEPVSVIASAGWGYCDAGCPLDHPQLQSGQVALETETNTPKTNRDRCAQRHAQPCVPRVLCFAQCAANATHKRRAHSVGGHDHPSNRVFAFRKKKVSGTQTQF